MFAPKLEELAGYSPRADILMQSSDGQHRLWIEFEVSRADPVANHAKFAVGHLLSPRTDADVYVAMVSAHVTRGRRNLATHAIALMRHVGLNAFQTILLPQFSGEQIKALNAASFASLSAETLSVAGEIERALTVVEPLQAHSGHRIHFAPDIVDVVENVRAWNHQVMEADVAGCWGRRTVTFFVYDAPSVGFAPAKFCAYVPAPNFGGELSTETIANLLPRMTIALYATQGESESWFDGYRARRYLTGALAMKERPLVERPDLQSSFHTWHQEHVDQIVVHQGGPIIITPPEWYR